MYVSTTNCPCDDPWMNAVAPDDVLWKNGGPLMWFHIWPDTMAKQKNCEQESKAEVYSFEWQDVCFGQYQFYNSHCKLKRDEGMADKIKSQCPINSFPVA